MKLEEAKELYSAGNPGPSHPRFKAWVAAENFLDGHASRDPEVADLKKDLALNASLLAKQCDLARQAESEVEKLKAEIEVLHRFSEMAENESYQRVQEFRSEREASRKLVGYAEHGELCVLTRWEGGEPTADGGYRSKYAGVWYQSKPVDETPKCTCGLDELFKKVDK